MNDTGIVETGVGGNISDHVSVIPSSFTFNTTQDVKMNFTAKVPGFFTGNVSFTTGTGDEINFTARLTSNVKPTDAGISAPPSIDLGYLPSGNTVSRQVQVENTGKIEITGITATSDTYSVSAEPVTIPAGETEKVKLTFESVSSDSGTVTLTAMTAVESAVAQVQVTANPVPDYVSKAETLSERIATITSRADNQSVKASLQSLEAKVAQIKTAYQRGNYRQAQQTYQSVSSTLDTIRARIGSGNQQPDNSQQKQGGFPVVMVAVVLFVLLLIGFIAYTSIIPERGDPLYNVLGR
ncbi:MAG: hypothetical protein ABEJ66_00240, partial [Candidatus Nanohaloarchaea archaeon]